MEERETVKGERMMKREKRAARSAA